MSFNIRIRAAGIVTDNNRILLNRFEKDGQIIYYNIVGGGLEKHEEIKDAVKREVYEESGINVDVNDLLFALEYEPKADQYIFGENYSLSLYFACSVVGSNQIFNPTLPDINPDDKSVVGKPEWVHIDQLLDIPLAPEINELLYNYMKTGIFDKKFISTTELDKIKIV